jgi:hypothetical protein
MKKAKEKLLNRLLEGSGDLFVEFVIVGLEETLDTILAEVNLLNGKPKLTDAQTTDLIELYHDGKATVRVLHYYTAQTYTEETVILNKAWDKFMQEMY